MAQRSAEILVIHPGALGDVLQAVPALAGLRGLAAGARLTLAAQPRIGELLTSLGAVHQSIAFDGLGLEDLFSPEPAAAPVRRRLARFGRIVSWFGARAELYPEQLRAIVPEALLAPPVPDPAVAPIPVWKHLVSSLETWGVTAAPPICPLAIPPAWSAGARSALAGLGADSRRPLLVAHPGAGAAWKRWPAPLMAGAIGRVERPTGCQVLVHQGPADRDAVEELVRALESPALRLVAPSLQLLAAVLAQSSAYLGADSGVSHLAAAVGAPAVIVFPAATRELWVPWSPTALALPMGEHRDDIDQVGEAVSERLRAR